MTQKSTDKELKTLNILQKNQRLEIAGNAKKQASNTFPYRVTQHVQNLMQTSKGNNPIAKQFMPTDKENFIREAESEDPIGDTEHSPVKGVIHRYPDRALLMLTNVCAVHCRYCFRRAKIGKPGGELKPEEIAAAIEYIRHKNEIWEVILSGGDPLILSDRKLAEAMTALRNIDHVKVLRIHTRIPIVKPERITGKLIAVLRACARESQNHKPLYIMLHCNSADELTSEARKACAMLADAGIPLLSQSVLLRGVNDRPEDMEKLLRACVETRIKPHYLHHGDLAQGTSHFRTTIAEGQNLLKKMRGNISGLCQPTYILDVPRGHGKVPIGPEFIKTENDSYLVADYRGNKHKYRDEV